MAFVAVMFVEMVFVVWLFYRLYAARVLVELNGTVD